MRNLCAILLLISASMAHIILFPKSYEGAVQFRWLPPERPFSVGEILHFTVIADNTTSDSAVCHYLETGEIYGEGISSFLVVYPTEINVIDTLASGESADYRYVFVGGTRWLYDPFKDVRSFEGPVGLPAFSPGEYKLKYFSYHNVEDSLTFTVVMPDSQSEEMELLDSVAQQYIAFQRGREKDVFRIARWMLDTAPRSPYTVRALFLARDVALREKERKEAIEMDSLFWENFGDVEIRHNYVGSPGMLKQTAEILEQCAKKKHISRYLDWLYVRFNDDEMMEEVEKVRKLLIE